MSIAHTSRKLIAYGLLIASLSLPSAVFAEEPDVSTGELAPGFNACEKRAADSAKNSTEYKEALLGCLNMAEKYWEPYVKERTFSPDEIDSDYSKRIDDAEKNYYQAWIQYKEACIELIGSDGDPLQAIRTRFFEVQEARRQALMMKRQYGLQTNEITEEFAPGFSMCIEKASERYGYGPDFRHAQSDCYESARKYWSTILEKNYNIYMNLYKDSPEMQKKLKNCQRAWKQYLDAGLEAIYAQGGKLAYIFAYGFEIEATRDQARMLDSSGPRW